MAAITKLGLDGYAVHRSGSFAGKTPDSGSGPHPVIHITRLSLDGYGVHIRGSFAGKTTADVPTGQGESSTGGRGGVAPWPSGYKYPYEKWWKKKKAQDLKKLKEAAEKKIAELERKAEEARRRIELARTIEAIAKATEVLAKFEQTLQDERNHLAEIEMLEFAIVWAIYKQSLYLQ